MIRNCILSWGRFISSSRANGLADRSTRDSLDILKKEFVHLCLRDQDCFRSEKGWEALLAILPSDRGSQIHSSRLQRCLTILLDIVGPLRTKWQNSPDRSSEAKWEDLQGLVAKLNQTGSPLFVRAILRSASSSSLPLLSANGRRPWKMSSSSIPILVSMPRCQNIAIICSKPLSVCIPVQVRISSATAGHC